MSVFGWSLRVMRTPAALAGASVQVVCAERGRSGLRGLTALPPLLGAAQHLLGEFKLHGANLRDPLLKDARVRQAIACAINRKLIIETLLRGHAQTAESLLPVNHWAWNGDVARYDFDPARAAMRLACVPAQMACVFIWR